MLYLLINLAFFFGSLMLLTLIGDTVAKDFSKRPKLVEFLKKTFS